MITEIYNKHLRNSILDPENHIISKYIKESSKKIKKNARVLDAGAGACPYKTYFSHTRYESTDFKDIFDKKSKKIHSFICNLEKIPKPDKTYDAIVCTQVLEHVPNPAKVLTEFNRTLKPGGRLIITVPQSWGVHSAPYHFFNFTNFGLQKLLTEAGFEIDHIKPRGGYFCLLGRLLRNLPLHIFSQIFFEQPEGGDREYNKAITQFLLSEKRNRPKPKIIGIMIGLPFFIILFPICYILIPPIFFILDKLDKRQEFTLGYNCTAIKKKPKKTQKQA
jgi:SAM-dependent methyltransferase